MHVLVRSFELSVFHSELLCETHLRDVVAVLNEILLERQILIVLLIHRKRYNEEKGHNCRQDGQTRTEVEWSSIGDGRVGWEVGDQSWERPSSRVCTNFALSSIHDRRTENWYSQKQRRFRKNVLVLQ